MRTNTILAALVALLIGILIGTYSAMAVKANATQASKFGVINAKAIILSDNSGKRRIVISAGTDTLPATFLLTSPDQKRGVLLTDGPNQAASMSISDNTGHPSITLLGANDEPSIHIVGEHNKPDVVLGSSKGSGYFFTVDAHGQIHDTTTQ